MRTAQLLQSGEDTQQCSETAQAIKTQIDEASKQTFSGPAMPRFLLLTPFTSSPGRPACAAAV